MRLYQPAKILRDENLESCWIKAGNPAGWKGEILLDGILLIKSLGFSDKFEQKVCVHTYIALNDLCSLVA